MNVKAASPRMAAVGRAIAALRIERGFTRQDLVFAAHVSYPFISEIEKGTKNPSYGTMARLADALGVTPSALMARAEAIWADPLNGLKP